MRRAGLTIMRLALLASGLLPGHVATAQEPQAPPRAPCPAIYQPVCAALAGKLPTYDNHCLAGRERAVFVGLGRCSENCGDVYTPVCAAAEGGRQVTYGNRCSAAEAGARVVQVGICGRPQPR
jgi:hypothetical protein